MRRLGLLALIFGLATLAPRSTHAQDATPTVTPITAAPPGFVVTPNPYSNGTRAVADLPASQHKKNVGGSDGSGLCVYTSVWHSALWQSVSELYDFRHWMESKPGGSYPEKFESTLAAYCKSKGIVCPGCLQHTGGDEDFLDLAIKTGRMPGITYCGMDGRYNSPVAHMVSLVHLDKDRAAIVDNNYPGTWLWMPRADFLARWRGIQTNGKAYMGRDARGRASPIGGGWAVVLLPGQPTPYPTSPPAQFAAKPKCDCGPVCDCGPGCKCSDRKTVAQDAPNLNDLGSPWMVGGGKPEGKAPCICGDSCKCATGDCPGKCPLAYAQFRFRQSSGGCPGGSCPSGGCPGGNCSPGTSCPGGNCPAPTQKPLFDPFAPIPVPMATGKWIESSRAGEYGYWIGERCTAWLEADGNVYAIDAAGKVTYRKISPPAPLPRTVNVAPAIDKPIVKADPVPPEFPQGGVDSSRMTTEKRYWCEGGRCTKEDAESVLGGKLADDSGRWNLVAVGEPNLWRKVTDDLGRLEPALREKINFKVYSPGDWQVAQFTLADGITLRKPAVGRVGATVGIVGSAEYSPVALTDLLGRPGGPLLAAVPVPTPVPVPVPPPPIVPVPVPVPTPPPTPKPVPVPTPEPTPAPVPTPKPVPLPEPAPIQPLDPPAPPEHDPYWIDDESSLVWMGVLGVGGFALYRRKR
jgi:hypothetical protein